MFLNQNLEMTFLISLFCVKYIYEFYMFYTKFKYVESHQTFEI